MQKTRPRFRERSFVYPLSGDGSEITLGTLTTYINGQPVSSKKKKASVAPSLGRELCWDRVNPVVRQSGSRKFRANGPLTLIKVDADTRASTGEVIGSDMGKPGITWLNRTEYRGVFACPLLNFDPHSSSYMDAGGLNLSTNPFFADVSSASESEAFDMRPKLERGGIFAALYETRELPALLRLTGWELANYWSGLRGRYKGDVLAPKKVADEFLAYQFGWAPFVRDVVKMLDSILFYQQYIHRLVAENNRWIRRVRTLEETLDRYTAGRLLVHGLRPTGADIDQLCVGHVEAGQVYYGLMEVFHEVKDLVWATGYFKYYRPELDIGNKEFFSLVNSVRRRILVHGARINPSHLYQILPWSWLIDWFTNLGSLIERLDAEANDGVVSRDLCVMRERITRIESIHTRYFYSGTQQFTTQRVLSSKRRVCASSPYGFVLGGDLTPTQWSIIGALGLSRNVRFTKSF